MESAAIYESAKASMAATTPEIDTIMAENPVEDIGGGGGGAEV